MHKVTVDAVGAKTYTLAALPTGNPEAIVDGLAAGTTSTFVVQATNDAGVAGPYSDELTVTTVGTDQPTLPPMVTGVAALACNDQTHPCDETSVTLDWSLVSTPRTLTKHVWRGTSPYTNLRARFALTGAAKVAPCV